MDMPKPQKAHEKLQVFVGKWKGEETIHPTPWDPGGKAVGEMKVTAAFGGFGIIQDYKQKRSGKLAYAGHGVLGYCATEKAYLWHWSDTMGGVPGQVTRGTWKGNKLTFQHGGEMGHVRYTYTFHKDGTQGFTIENSQDGQTWSTFIEARYTKVG